MMNIGAIPQNVKRVPLIGGNEWTETPYFAPGLEKDTENMKAMPAGHTLAGYIRDIRETKAENDLDRRKYICLEDFNGIKFRIAAPAQLVYLVEKAGIGTPVAITYKGKEEVEGYKKPLHQFSLEILEIQ